MCLSESYRKTFSKYQANGQTVLVSFSSGTAADYLPECLSGDETFMDRGWYYRAGRTGDPIGPFETKAEAIVAGLFGK